MSSDNEQKVAIKDNADKDNVQFEYFPPAYGVLYVILTVIVFQILGVIVKRRGLPAVVQESDSWRWRNLYISWIHALIVGSWDILCFLLYPEMFDNIMNFQNRFIYGMVTVSTGYFVYDFIEMGLQGLLISQWEITLHHIAVGSTFFYNLMQNKCVAYTAIALLSEVNTIFLHSRKLLQMQKMSFSHWFYRIIVYVNLFTFVFGRFVAVTAILVGMALFRDQVSSAYFYTLTGAMIIMIPVNIVLFWRLFKSDIIRPRQERLKKLANASHSENGVTKEQLTTGFA